MKLLRFAVTVLLCAALPCVLLNAESFGDERQEN